MADKHPETQQGDGNGVRPASPGVPVDDTPAPAGTQRSRLTAPAHGSPRAPKTHARNIRMRARGEGNRFARPCQDDRLPNFCSIPGVAYRKCPSCHVSVRKEPCLCKGVQSGPPEADETERLTTSSGPNGWTLVGTGRQFPAPDHTRSPQYPPDVTLEDDGAGGEEENQEIILDGIVSSPRFDGPSATLPLAKKAASPNSTVVDPGRVVADVSLKARNVSDGEACYPPYVSLDGDNDDDRTECETEYPSNGSTYGSVSDDEAYMSDTPTFSTASVSSSLGSFELIEQAEVAGSRIHTGAEDKGKGTVSNEGNNCHGEIRYVSSYGQKRGGRDEGAGGRGKRPKNNPPADQESGESDNDDSENRFACPFFKNDPLAHGKCGMWSGPSLSRVKGHVLWIHLKPLQCPRCGIFRAGDDGQVEKHLRDSNCEKPATFVPVDESTVWKGDDLKKGSEKAVTWQQVYMELFDCQQHEVPSPYFAPSSTASENGTVVGDSFQPVGAIPAPAATPSTDGSTNRFSEILSGSGFQRFAQEWLTKALAQQLPRLIAGHLPQILDEYVREATLEHDNSQRAAPSTALSGPSSNLLMRTTTYSVPFAAATSLEGPNVASQSLFPPPQRLSPQPTSYNPMPMYMSAPLPGAAMTIGQQHSHHSYPAGGGDNVYASSYPANDEENLSAYLHSDMGDYHFVDIERLE